MHPATRRPGAAPPPPPLRLARGTRWLAPLVALPVALLLALGPACGDASGGGTGTAAVVDDPELPGPYAFELWVTDYDTVDFGVFQAHVYEPVAPVGRTDLPGPPHPGVVLSNGYASKAGLMTWLSEHLASHGYLVLAFSPGNPFLLDITNWATGFSRGLDTLVERSAEAGSPIEGALDPERLGVIGLSMGGAGVLEAAGTDPRIDAVVSLAPGANDLGGFVFADTLEASRSISVPTQIQVGSQDCFVNPHPPSLLSFTNLTGKGPLHYFEAMTATPRMFVEIAGGNHVQFVNAEISSLGHPAITEILPIDCAPAITPAEQQRVSLRYAVPWFDTYLQGTDAWKDRLFGAGAREDVESGILSELSIER